MTPPLEAGRIARSTVAAWLVAGTAAWALVAVYLAHFGVHWALDLRVYRDAGRSLYDGMNPYTGRFTGGGLPFTYPPFGLLVLSPLALWSLGGVEVTWWVLNGVALVVLVSLVCVHALGLGTRRAIAVGAVVAAVGTLALEPLRSNFDYGQLNVLLMLLVVIDVTSVRGRGPGVLVGIAAAIKLTPLLYLAYFLLERDRRAMIRGAVTFAGATALSWLVLPAESWRYWIHEAFLPSRAGVVGWATDQSWNGLFHRPPFHGGAIGAALWLVVAAGTLVVGILAARRWIERGRRIEALLALALSELLVSPISWSHHWSWLILLPVVAWANRQDHVLVWSFLAVTAVAIAAPYGWGLHGWPGAVCDDSLTVSGAALLVVLGWRAVGKGTVGARPALSSPVLEAASKGPESSRYSGRGWPLSNQRRQ